MGRLIDADRLKAHYCWWAGGSKEMSIDEAKKTFDTIIDIQPTVDAEPVRHGHWYKTYDDEGEAWMCSECCEEWAFEEGHPKDVYGCNYCPNCGAKMDETLQWEEPEINPCRGCEDYDSQGGCLSKGGCGERKEDGQAEEV